MNEKGIKWNEWNKKAEDHVGMQALSDTILLRVKWRMLLITWYKGEDLSCVCVYICFNSLRMRGNIFGYMI